MCPLIAYLRFPQINLYSLLGSTTVEDASIFWLLNKWGSPQLWQDFKEICVYLVGKMSLSLSLLFFLLSLLLLLLFSLRHAVSEGSAGCAGHGPATLRLVLLTMGVEWANGAERVAPLQMQARHPLQLSQSAEASNLIGCRGRAHHSLEYSKSSLIKVTAPLSSECSSELWFSDCFFFIFIPALLPWQVYQSMVCH